VCIDTGDQKDSSERGRRDPASGARVYLAADLANYPYPEKDQAGEDKSVRQGRVNQMYQKITISRLFWLSSKRNDKHFVLSIRN
jgi:hypothetical protein